MSLLRVRILSLVALLALSACGSQTLPGMAVIPEGALITHRAVFIGESNHETVGTVSLYQSGEHPVLVFGPNFRISGTPDAVVALGSDGRRHGTAVLGALLRPRGAQAYAVPPGIDIDRFNEVWLWNVISGKPVGLARLTPVTT